MITPKDILESMFWLKMKFKREIKPYSIPEDFLFSKIQSTPCLLYFDGDYS
jgi:hypothetical protein